MSTMARDDSFHEYIMSEVLQGIDGVTSRPMFGGFGIYKDGAFFALISKGELYFKVDESNKSDFEKYDSKPFVYTDHKGKDVTLSYWLVPEEIMENKGELAKWVDKSVEARRKSNRT